MPTSPELSFGALLQQYRRAAGLSQEELAERAGVGVRTISDLERGVAGRPQRHTMTLLVEALVLDGAARAAFEAAGRRPAAHPPVPASRPAPAVPATPAAQAAAPTPVPPHPAALPGYLTPVVGREREEAAVAQLLCRPGVRLLTLTGPGGIGKTRLAVQVAGLAGAADLYPDGVAFVPLAPLADPALVLPALAQAVGVRQTGEGSLREGLDAALRGKRLLLVLDNFEHVVAAAPEVAAVLARCPGVQALVTSRVALRVQGEHLFRVPPLATSDPDQDPTPAGAALFPAVALFVQRAQAVRPDFAPTDENAATVAAICRRLDGLPLAIELAAARLNVLPVDEILARLEDRFRLLTGGPRDAPARQRTLRATLDWSWGLLQEPERMLLWRLSVFAGGWTLAAAEAVCAGDGIEEGEILDLQERLIDASLVLRDARETAARYGLLETVRQYAAEQLLAASTSARSEATAIRDRHLDWCVALAEEAATQLFGADQGYWLARLELDHDNLRAALGWARERGEGEAGLRLVGALWRFWYTRGYLSEGRAWLDGALARGEQGHAALRATALNGAGGLAYQQGDYGRAAALYEEALTLRRALGDRQGVATALNNLGIVAFRRGDYRRAAALHEEALGLRRTLGDRQGVAGSLNGLGLVAYQQGDYGRAADLFNEVLALRRAMGDRQGIAGSLNNLGLAAYAQGDHGRAAALLEEALALHRALGDRQGIAASLDGLGQVACVRDDHGRATILLDEALALRRALGDKEGIAGTLNNLAAVAYRQGDHGRAMALLDEALVLSRDIDAREPQAVGLEILAWLAMARGQSLRAARLGGAVEAARAVLGVPVPPDEQADHAQAVRAMRQALGEDGFAAAWAAGRALSLEAAVAEALAAA